MKRASKLLEELGFPGRDAYDLPSSPLTFPDGAHYRIEISGVERPEVLDAVVDEAIKRNIPVHRLISTVMGATLLSKDELKTFARIAHDAKVEVIITPGPRASWDIGRQVATPEGALCGMRFRGADALAQYIEDILRAIDIGFRGFLVWDEGALMVLNEMREQGKIPKNTVFKVSIFAGHANPAGAKLLEQLGANTFNPIADITLPMFAAIRKTIKIPIDVHVYLFDTWGGFNRFRETPELARVASPVYFKIEPGPSVGNLYKPWIDKNFLANFGREKVKYATIIREIIEENEPDLKLSEQGPEDLAIPEV